MGYCTSIIDGFDLLVVFPSVIQLPAPRSTFRARKLVAMVASELDSPVGLDFLCSGLLYDKRLVNSAASSSSSGLNGFGIRTVILLRRMALVFR